MPPFCARCRLYLTQVIREGVCAWLCVCCDATMQRGTLDDCRHKGAA